jgi:hypothetical protein
MERLVDEGWEVNQIWRLAACIKLNYEEDIKIKVALAGGKV